jgi:hypothetical protein
MRRHRSATIYNVIKIQALKYRENPINFKSMIIKNLNLAEIMEKVNGILLTHLCKIYTKWYNRFMELKKKKTLKLQIKLVCTRLLKGNYFSIILDTISISCK